MTAKRPAQVVVGVDPSFAGLRALRFAVAEARRRAVPLRALRAWQAGGAWTGYDTDDGRVQSQMLAATTLVEAFNLALGGPPDDVRVELLTQEGPTVAVLLGQASQEDDLLVVGASGGRIGSWSKVDGQCVRRASCPVVVVPAPALARQDRMNALAREVVRVAQLVAQAAAGDHDRRPPD